MLLTSFLRSLTPTASHSRRELRAWAADWGGIICLLTSAYFALCMFWYMFQWGGPRYAILINDLLIFPIGLTTVLLAWRASRHSALDRCTQRAWRLLAIGVIGYTVGALLWFRSEIILNTTRFPSWADACFLLTYPAFLGGMLSFPVEQHTRNEWWKLWLDGAIVLLASGMGLWVFMIMPIAAETGNGLLIMLLALAYPAGDLLLLFGILAVMLRRPHPRSITSLHLLVIAFALYFVGDIAFTTLNLRGTFESGSWIDACWLATMWLIGLSAHIQHRQAEVPARAEVGNSLQRKTNSTLPYLAVALGNVLLILVERDHLLTAHGPILVAVVLLNILVVLRQIVAVRENTRLLAEQSVLQSEAHFRSLVQHASDLITVIEPDGTIRYQSPSSERVLGYAVASLLGSNFFALVDPDDHPALHGVLADAQSPTLELRLRHQDGGWRHVEVVSTNLLAEPNVRGIVLNGRDISERKCSEAAQRRSEERFQLAAQATNDALWDFDLSTMQGWWSTAYTSSFGVPSGEIPPGTWEEHLHPDERERVIETVEALAATGQASWLSEYRFRRGDGTYANVIDRGYLVRNEHGTPTRMLGAVMDITQRTQAEEALRQAKEEAEQANRAKSAFLATMSHEIRTPMNGILGMTDLLIGTPLSAEQREYATIIRESGRALLQLINDILDFSKIEAEKIVLEQEPFAPRQLIGTIADVLIAQAREKRIELLTYIAPEVPQEVRGDAGRLRQILLNLVGNAVKFTETGEVSLRVSVENVSQGHVMLRYEVYDTGIGLTQPQIARLFQPFTQADGSMTRKYGGTGLGLAISKRLVELMSGTIEVASVIGQGSTFRCVIPHTYIAPPKNEAPTSPLAGIRVLIVDGPGTSRDIVCSYLEAWSIRSDTATSGTEALSHLQQAGAEPYRLVLIDEALPDMTPGEFAGAARASHHDLPPLLLIRYMDTALPATGYIESIMKPLKQSALYNTLTNVLDQFTCTSTQPTVSPERPSQSPQPSLGSTGHVILVAEDNPVNQKLILMQLKKLGYLAHAVATGRAAVAAVAEETYSLVLMDCQMPEMDGLEATSVIRVNTVGQRHVPIIALTANAMQGDREACLKAGMDDYLSKPINMEALQTTIARWLPH